jgi:protein-disulfide isomerase
LNFHAQAQKAAEAAECAGEQGKYWEMHDELFEAQGQWSGNQNAIASFKQMADDLGLDKAQFNACLDEGRYAARIAADLEEGRSQGVSGTPAFRINGMALSGAQPFEKFAELVDYFLAGGEPPTLEVAADSFRSTGEAGAPVLVTAFCDYQYPPCSSFGQEVVPTLIQEYADTGQVRFVYRSFSLSPATETAAQAAMCAGEQDQYWAMNESLYASASEWAEQEDPSSLFGTYAGDLGLDLQAFSNCLSSGATAMDVKADRYAGEKAAIDALPYVFVGSLKVRGETTVQSLGRVIDWVEDGRTEPEIVPVDDDWHVRGDRSTARAVAVAFVDYADSESADHAREVLPQLIQTYVDSGQMLYVLQPWAADQGGPSTQAAVAAECAGEQAKFWEMHEQIFTEQAAWVAAAEPRTLFSEYAGALGLDAGAFETCLDSDWAVSRAEAGAVVAALYGVPRVPIFLFNNGQGQEGSPTFEQFQAIIDPILNQ